MYWHSRELLQSNASAAFGKGLFKQQGLAHGSSVCGALLGDCYRTICALAEKALVNVENKTKQKKHPETLIALFTASISIWRIACENNIKLRAGSGQRGNLIHPYMSRMRFSAGHLGQQ